jgi:xylulose-5-phosphate/fructose-6-phosphate phosphoketolase
VREQILSSKRWTRVAASQTHSHLSEEWLHVQATRAVAEGWTAPREVKGHYLEDFWRAHQVPLLDVKKDSEQLRILEMWMRSLKPEAFFDDGKPASNKLAPVFTELAPSADRRMSANSHANGGRLKKALRLPDFRAYAVSVERPAQIQVENTRQLRVFLGKVMKQNLNNFRVFGPDETTSNRLDAIYNVTRKFWIEECFPPYECTKA